MAKRLCAVGSLMTGDPLAWYAGKRVFMTGHTGFKGAWLTLWLQRLGSSVTGYALPPEGRALFADASVGDGMTSLIGDIRDSKALREAIHAAEPDIVFHLAAQSIVRRSYDEPVATFATNVLGTANLLDAVRDVGSIAAAVIVTSDKCYENDASGAAYAETAPMGGHDPYSASKGCAELVTSAFARSFFHTTTTTIVSARAGNVIGGGDWAVDRIIPDLMRAAETGVPARIRRPSAVRPWQHVLEPLYGYLLLGARAATAGDKFAGGWNFGPSASASAPVSRLIELVQKNWPAAAATIEAQITGPEEAALLRLDSSKAHSVLGWTTHFSLERAVATTVDWYRHRATQPGTIGAYTDHQIGRYASLISAKQWSDVP